MTHELTRVGKSSSQIRAMPEPAEPALEPLIPAESILNLAAYSRFLESVLSATLNSNR